jgi:hypothetical protein
LAHRQSYLTRHRGLSEVAPFDGMEAAPIAE